MYSFVAGTIKPASNYEWFTYDGSPMLVNYRGADVKIERGQKFGVRKSGNGKQIRLVLGDDINRVITLTLDQAKRLARNVKAEG